MMIKLPNDFLTTFVLNRFTASKEGLNEISPPTGSGAEGMPAAQSLLALFGEFQSVLNSYAGLIEYDGKDVFLTGPAEFICRGEFDI
jgi:hypothetical protein